MKISQKESNLILMYFRPDTNYYNDGGTRIITHEIKVVGKVEIIDQQNEKLSEFI